MFEQAFKNIDDVLWKEAGCTTELDYTEQTSVAQQTLLIGTLDELAEETQRLESLYQKKLAVLDDLKKSLLHQAFSGQL